MTKVEITVRRPNGNTEVVDMSKNFNDMNSTMLDKIRKATKDGGRGDVLSAEVFTERSNCYELRTAYNNLQNEGGEGYEPDDSYFESLPEYKTWTETKTIK